MIVELHMLQNFAPSCLNRDDTNTPKDAEFGGYRRARISSQCVKRSIRRFFAQHDLLPAESLAVRTKRLVDEATDALVKKGKPEDEARAAVTVALAAGGLKTDDKGHTQYLLFLGRREIEGLVQIVDDHFDALKGISANEENSAGDKDDDAKKTKKTKKKKTAKQQKAEAKKSAPDAVVKSVKKLLDGGRSADLALFGRMLADMPQANIDAACQVAHAISTNRVAMEMDYFTAVDDLQVNSDDAGAGAGMIGNVEFNSSCFYRYASIDTDQLVANLDGDGDLAEKTVTAFLRASVEAVPTGKQNTFAAHNPPSFVFAAVRPTGQWSLANAFVEPIAGAGSGLINNSIREIDRYWGQLTKMYGVPQGLQAAVATTETEGLDTLGEFRKEGVVDVYDAVAKAIGGASQ